MTQEIEQINASLKAVSDQLKAHAERAEKEIKASAKLSEETRASVDKMLTVQGELQARLQAAEQLVAKMEQGGGRDDAPMSLGRQFVTGENFKAFAGQTSPRGRVDMTVNAAITSLTTDTAGAAGDLVEKTRLPGIVALPQRRMTVRDLIAPGQMDGSTLEYVKETGFTNSAAPVAEGAAKPESDLKFDLVTTSAKVIAHWMKASKQILSDVSQLRSVIDERLLYGLAYYAGFSKRRGLVNDALDTAVALAVGFVTASLLLDQYGVLQAPKPVDAVRIAGALLVLAGVVLVVAPWRTMPSAKATVATDNAASR